MLPADTQPSFDEATFHKLTEQPLAMQGGPAVVGAAQDADLFHWPHVTEEDERAVLDVLRAGSMSGIDATRKFEQQCAAYHGVPHALGYPNGTMALQAAMWAVGLRRGDEMICPTLTYWASALQAFSLGVGLVFADVDPLTLCLDPQDLERRITDRTRAVMVVHYCGHPADMDAIGDIARRHNLKVIEDVSHAHGGLYKGRVVGSIGDVSAMSLMSAKPLAVGEAGMLMTRDRSIYEAAVAFSHYERAFSEVHTPELRPFAAADGFMTGLPMGGVKGRMNQVCAAMGRIQLKHYPQRMAEIQRAMHFFWNLLEGTPGIRPHRTATGDHTTTMGGWYNPLGHYIPEELGGLPVERFVEAVQAEGGRTGRAANFPLHLHPLFNEADIYGDGRTTRNAFAARDLRQTAGTLPVAERVDAATFGVPAFKKADFSRIASYAAAYRKVALQASRLQA